MNVTRQSIRHHVVVALAAVALAASAIPAPPGTAVTTDLVGTTAALQRDADLRPPLVAVAALLRAATSGPAAAARSAVVPATRGPGADDPGAEPAEVPGTDAGPDEPPPDRNRKPPARTFTIVVTGDMLLHGPVVTAARRGGGYDFRPLLAGIRRPIAGADLALCHLEVPLTRDLSALSGYPTFNAPHHFADALAATGYDGCSVASNHAYDRGAAGVRATLRALDAAGIGHAGTARTRREARRTRSYRLEDQTSDSVSGRSRDQTSDSVSGRSRDQTSDSVSGRSRDQTSSSDRGGSPDLQVAHLSYTYGLNGRRLPRDRRWMVDLIDRRRIVADARRARRAGADLVLVSLHWGQEYVSTPTPAQVRLAGRLLASPAIDALIGHHAHVVQPVARRSGKVVAFGLGNLLSNQTAACCHVAAQDGVIVRLVVRRRPDGSAVVADVEYLPTMVRHPQRRVVIVRDALRRGATGGYRRQLRASLRRTRQAIGDLASPSN